MSDRSASFLDGFRKPEYTGENRCVPCTVVNALLAAAGSVAVSLGVSAYAGVGAPLVLASGLAVLVPSALLIYLRGYLVPGTPELTKRYLPRRALALFGKDPVAERTGSTDGEHPGEFDEEAFTEAVEEITERHEQSVDPETFLEEAGVIDPDGDGDYRLTDDTADAVQDRMATYREESIATEAVATLFDTTAEDIEELDRGYPAYRIGVRIRKWPSEGAWIADVATHEVLAETTDGWADLPTEQRVDTLAWLRGLHPACPMCGGETRFSDDVIESCCGRFEVTTIACMDCSERLREFDPAKVGNREDLKGITP
jgi:hypothetical protein